MTFVRERGGAVKEFLQNALPFWASLTDNEKNTLITAANIELYKRGTVFYHGGDECSGVKIVKSGRARVFINSPNGKEMTLYRLYDNDFCMMSVACMLRNINFKFNLETETDCEIAHIPRQSYKRLLDENPAVKNFTLELMASKFTDVMWLFEQMVFSTNEERLANELVEQIAVGGSYVIEITHEKIAADLGTAREVVTRMLKRFQNEGLVSLSRGKIEILNEKALLSKIG